MPRQYTLDLEKSRKKRDEHAKPELQLTRSIKILTPLPSTVDLRPKMPPVYDQGSIGSCTANVFVAAFQYLDPTFYGSRLFLYYNERVIQGNVNVDTGATLDDGIVTLTKEGVCSETIWPYIVKKFTTQPAKTSYINALKHKIIKYEYVQNTLFSIKQTLVSGVPILCGIAVYNSFEANIVTRTGVVPMPKLKDKLLGGHAVMIVGYNDSKQWWIMRNCWGPKWGDKGYFYLPYAYLLNPNLCTELCNIRSVTRDI